MEGAAYCNGSISRYCTLSGTNPSHLLIGPWDHGARINVSPWRRQEAPEFAVFSEVLRFFDHYLLEISTGLDQEDPIHYFTMHSERWRSARTWPPVEETETLYFGRGLQLKSTRDANGATIGRA